MKQQRLLLDLAKFQSQLKFRKANGVIHIYDPIRDRYMVQTPEELVRQLLILYLQQELNWPMKLIAVEKMLVVNERRKRFDILCILPNGKPILLIECKSPKVPISLSTFEQVSAYNLSLKVPYLLVSNGLVSYCCKVDLIAGEFDFLDSVPSFEQLSY